jgi:ribonucleotide monophosphatase NagD (HAD superfamily)
MKGLLSDLDDAIRLGDQPVAGAGDTLDLARSNEIPLLFPDEH